MANPPKIHRNQPERAIKAPPGRVIAGEYTRMAPRSRLAHGDGRAAVPTSPERIRLGRGDGPHPRYEGAGRRGSGRLCDKFALITGADSGIGRAVAVAFGREGADVTIAGARRARSWTRSRLFSSLQCRSSRTMSVGCCAALAPTYAATPSTGKASSGPAFDSSPRSISAKGPAAARDPANPSSRPWRVDIKAPHPRSWRAPRELADLAPRTLHDGPQPEPRERGYGWQPWQTRRRPAAAGARLGQLSRRRDSAGARRWRRLSGRRRTGR